MAAATTATQVNLSSKKMIHLMGHAKARDRYSTDHTGLLVDAWRQFNRWFLHERPDQLFLHLFTARSLFEEDDAIKLAQGLGYRSIVLEGVIHLEPDQWIIETLAEISLCRDFVRKISTDTPDLLRYYRDFEARAANGDSLGTIGHYSLGG